MTLDQFRDMALEGLIVECHTVQERRDTLELFEVAGLEISGPTMEHLLVAAEDDYDTGYMHPGISRGRRYVTCYKYFERAKIDVMHAVSYNDIQDLIESPSMLDERSDAEFAEDFASLIDPQGSKHNAIIEAEFTSIWDGGFAVTTGCKVNTTTKEVFNIEVSTEVADMVNNLDEEYITIDGENYPVVSDEYMENAPEERGSYWYKK